MIIMIVSLSPANLDSVKTFRTLNFLNKVREITNTHIINVISGGITVNGLQGTSYKTKIGINKLVKV